MSHLYTYDGSTINGEDFLAALRHIGVQEGDTIFVHSNISVFGKPNLIKPDLLLKGLVDVLQQSVCNGTLILPTFTYSFGRDLPFDRQKSGSLVGSLTEFFRTQSGVMRTNHPMHSVAVWGAHANEILDINKDTFGAGTVFEKLRTLKAKIVFLGTSMEPCTFLHHVEQMHTVPYRFMKTFTGVSIDEGRTYEDSCTYYARRLDLEVENDMTRIVPILRDKNVLYEAVVGNGSLVAVEANTLFEEGMRQLDMDPYALTARTI